ncbi:hypothetical protein PAERUG_P45_London_17_VIM_2_12_12_01303 [Pseudomonas aeruginosa]|nr:hypothetical protein PAERUG_P45_London_17_VIM_2_12_12_01303 [Pseudomonas aeruginosa]CRX23799.1 hypothetical protein PAERUG_P54_1_London_24_VIM_2_04_13_03921 [Pseudomonas aeruginosa]
MHDGQAIGVDRSPGLLGHEVVHHAEEADREDEADHAVPVPPLDHRVGGAGIGRVGLAQAHRQQCVVHHMDHRGDDDEGAVEPVADVDVLHLATGDGAEEQVGIDHPDDRHPQRQRPFHLGVFLGGGIAQRVADDHPHDRRLPAPEHEARQGIGDQPHAAGALHHVEGGGEQRAAAEGEDHQAGVDRADAAEAGPGQVEVERRPDQLGGDEHPEAHAEDAPDQGHQGELADDVVVVAVRIFSAIRIVHGRWHAGPRGPAGWRAGATLGSSLGYRYFSGYPVAGSMECGGRIFVWKARNRRLMALVAILGGELDSSPTNNVAITVQNY